MNKETGLNRIFWENFYKNTNDAPADYDLWLDKYQNFIAESRDTPILDLGCGKGNNSLYLKKQGYQTVCCDFSRDALKIVKKTIPDSTIKCFDMTTPFPINNKSYKVVIADLSIHYFSFKTTQFVISEISRILTDSGLLLCRVNSINDINHGAGTGKKIEENYYETPEGFKRFFTGEEIRTFFNNWKIEYLNEAELSRYKKSKILWEFAARK